ncbi:hypothetical protein [Snodgrassella alvi]|uniref:hypothetical protein n=1 Tax=Snodgrassella alvi TaxID=1196083 RepID=UPI001C53814E|nr:hypothetical protein [Snodgrassella alvi]
MKIAQAAAYCGCSVTHFRKNIAPYLPAQNWLFENGAVYDKQDIDKYIDDKKVDHLANTEKKIKNTTGGKRLSRKGNYKWSQKDYQDSLSGTVSGTSINNTEAEQFAEVLTQVRRKKRKLS